MENYQVVLVGDSITEHSVKIKKNNVGWGSRLIDYYNNVADILVRARSSHTSRSLLQFLPQLFTGIKPSLVIYTIGSNDASIKDWEQHVPLDEYVKNVKLAIEIFKNCGAKKILLVTPPPLGEEMWNAYSTMKYGLKPNIKSFELTKSYAEAIVNLVNELNDDSIRVINLWADLDLWLYNKKKAFYDGLHLSHYGNKLFYKELKQEMDKYIDLDNSYRIPSYYPNS